MLYLPHNFIKISFRTLGIITYDWAIDYHNKSPVSLEGFGLNSKHFDSDNIAGYCDSNCVTVNKSCGIGKYELEEFLQNVTGRKEEFKWTWLCLQTHYNVKDILSVPQFAIPDLLYYSRFLWVFLTTRPWFGFMKSKADLPNYYCYNKEDRCEVRSLVSHYWVVVAIGFILWVYCPLLVHYLPSSSPRKLKKVPTYMFPSYKYPIFFGRYVEWLLCFYTEDLFWIRVRRFIFLVVMAVTSLRLFYPPYCFYSWLLLLLAVVASLIPSSLSDHVRAELPSRFFGWNLPEELMRVKTDLPVYQGLGHVMLERLYLSVDQRFWAFVIEKSFQSFNEMRLQRGRRMCTVFMLGFFTFPLGCLLFVIAFVWNLLVYFNPFFYFCQAHYCAVWVGMTQYIDSVRACEQSSGLGKFVRVVGSCCHALVMFGLLTYTIIVIFIWCYLVSEVTMFTFIGGVVTVSMGFHYFLLFGAFVTAVYTLVSHLHEEYDCILTETINLLKEKDTFAKIKRKVFSKSDHKVILELEKKLNDELKFKVVVKKNGESLPYRQLLFHDGITSYINKDMYDSVVERVRPLRRQVFFVVVKILVIVFYCSTAVWVKNVYHMEEKVGTIFSLVKSVAVSFLPSALQFISYRSRFGIKTDVVLRHGVYESLVEYLCQLG